MSSRRSASRAADRTRIWAAASSIASGSPSSLRQTCSTATALSSASRNEGRTSWARCSNSLTASNSASVDAPGVVSSRGSDSGGTGQLCSPSTPSSSRLVVRIDKEAQARSRRSARSATAAARCSQLSRTSSTGRSPMCSAIVIVTSCPGTSGMPRPSATACGAMAGSSIGASSTQHTPPGNRPCATSAAARASRVFPVPPGPVRVTSRLRARASTTSWSSRWRPTSGASRTGSRPVFSAATRPPSASRAIAGPLRRVPRPRLGGAGRTVSIFRRQLLAGAVRRPPRPGWRIRPRPARRASWAWAARRPQRRRRRGPAGGSSPALAAGTPPASPGAGSPCTRERPRHSPAPPAAR